MYHTARAYTYTSQTNSESMNTSILRIYHHLQHCHLPSKQVHHLLIFEAVLQSRRNSSAPGPNGISNVIWKRCPTLQRRLFSVITRVWTTCCIPPSWQRATIRLIHKYGPATEPSNFRPIALTNCDGKIFFALVGKAIREHMIRNSFFDLRLQKGFLPGVAGCLEHSSLRLLRFL